MAALSQYEFDTICTLLNEHFLGRLEAGIAQAEETLKAVARLLEEGLPAGRAPAEDTIQLRKQLLVLAQNQQPPAGPQPFAWYFPALTQQLNNFIDQQEATRVEIQEETRFLPQQDDPAWLRTAKFWKRRLRNLNLKGNAENGFLNSLKRAMHAPPQQWPHEIPWQLLLRRHLQLNLMHRLQELINIGERHRLEILKSASVLSQLPDRQPPPARSEMLQEIQSRLQQATTIRRQASELLHRQLEAVSGRLYIELEKEYAKAGTIELPAARLRLPLLQKAEQDRQQKLEEQLNEWKNVQLCLCSHWSLMLQVHTIADGLELQLQQARHHWQERLEQGLGPAFEQLSNRLMQVRQQLTHSPLPEAFSQSRKLLGQPLQQDVGAAAELLNGLTLPARIQALEEPFQEILASLPELSTLSQNPMGKEVSPLPDAALASFSPRELVGLELLPHTLRTLTQKRNELAQQLEEIGQRLLELQEICLHSLSTAQAHWEEHPQEEEQALRLATDGIDHALEEINGLGERLQQLTTALWQDLEQLVVHMGNSLLQLNSTENALGLQQQLVRRKTRRQKSAQQKPAQQQGMQRLQALLQNSLRSARLQQQRFWTRLNAADSLPAPPEAPVLSAYLSEKEQALQRLPLVYRRLFSAEPLRDTLFLVGRRTELTALQEAYRRWQEGRFTAVLITGEKGGGCSSLITVFRKKVPELRSIRLPLQAWVPDTETLARLFADKLGLPENSSWQALQAYLQHPPGPLMLIVEDLQYLFRRQLGGLALMSAFQDLLRSSSTQVFWLCSCNHYAWRYMQKAADCAVAWSLVQPLETFSPLQFQELIMRRHLVSGYQLHYQAGAAEQHNAAYTSLTAEDKQAYLEENYFKQLAGFAQGNLQLALLYWQWSALGVSKDTITINTGLPTSIPQLEELASLDYFILHALLLHEQLDATALAQILHEAEATCRSHLQLLHTQGIVLATGERFRLSLLTYRQLVLLLRHKNLLH
jgi:hypothetical protein